MLQVDPNVLILLWVAFSDLAQAPSLALALPREFLKNGMIF